MNKAQGALEYMIIIAAILAVAAVTVVFITRGATDSGNAAQLAKCKEVATQCRTTHLLVPNDPCVECETSCEKFGDAIIQLCKEGKPGDIYSGATGGCTTGATNPCTMSNGCVGTQTCTDGTWGVCLQTVSSCECGSTANCAVGETCDSGTCIPSEVECTFASDCGTAPECKKYTCTLNDCILVADLLNDGTSCGVGGTCDNGVCELPSVCGNGDCEEDEYVSGVTTTCIPDCCNDVDGDEYYSDTFTCPLLGTDCNDKIETINPGAAENTEALCADGADNDCDGSIDCSDSLCIGTTSCPTQVCTDADNDNYCKEQGCGGVAATCTAVGVDCNDANAAIKPGAAENTEELCDDNIDNDCDGSKDCEEFLTCGSLLTCTCGNGNCDKDETVSNCPADCEEEPTCVISCSKATPPCPVGYGCNLITNCCINK